MLQLTSDGLSAWEEKMGVEQPLPWEEKMGMEQPSPWEEKMGMEWPAPTFS